MNGHPFCNSCQYGKTYRIYQRIKGGKGYQPIGWTCDSCHAIWRSDYQVRMVTA